MELPPFELHRPREASEVVQLLTDHAGDVDLLAGGTDLLPNYKNRLNHRGHVVSLQALMGCQELSEARIGAMVRLVDLEHSPLIRSRLPILAETAAAISSPPLRAHGTVGGNLMLDTRCHYVNQSPLWRQSKGFCLKADGERCLVVPASEGRCYATYSGELAAAFLVLDAQIVLMGPRGHRSVAIGRFFHEDGIVRFTDKRADELLVAITLPAEASTLAAGYMKLRVRDSIDFPSLGMAIAVSLDSRGRIERLRVAQTAMQSRPMAFDELCSPLIGQPASPALAAELGEQVKQHSKAYNNVPLDPKYRRKMVAVFVRRLLARLDERFQPRGLS